MHIRNSRTVMSHRNQIIEYIARKSLICLILTFVVNLAMNLFKVTKFIGNRSDVSSAVLARQKSAPHDYILVFHCLFRNH